MSVEHLDDPSSASPAPNLEGVSVGVDARTVQQPGIGFYAYFKGAVRCLLDMGAQVCLLTNFPTEQYRELFPKTEWTWFGSRRNLIWDQYDLPKFLRKRQFDLYWAPTNNGIPFLPVKQTWTISTTHDLVPLDSRALPLPRPAFALPYLVWTPAAMLSSDTILTVSASSPDIRRYFLRRAAVVPRCSATCHLPGPRRAPASLRDKSYVVYNGGLDPRKNAPNLLAAFAVAVREWPDLTLALVGNGYQVFDPEIRSLGISESVVRTLCGHETRTALIKSAVAVAYPRSTRDWASSAGGLRRRDAGCAGGQQLLVEVAGDAAVLVDPPVRLDRRGASQDAGPRTRGRSSRQGAGTAEAVRSGRLTANGSEPSS